MPDNRGNRVPGGTFFFTVNLLDRRSDLLVTHIEALRDAARRVRARAPCGRLGVSAATLDRYIPAARIANTPGE